MKHLSVLFILLVALGLSACDSSLPPSPVPAPKAVSTSPVATPAQVVPAASLISPVPTPAAGQGVVTGILIDQRTGQPAVKTILYLEPSMNHEAPPLLYGPLNNQPKTTSLEGGQFIINNVPPGEYILALYSPVDILFYQRADGTAVLVQVKPGEVTDLETVATYIP